MQGVDEPHFGYGDAMSKHCLSCVGNMTLMIIKNK